MIIIGKGVKPAAGTKSTTKVAVIIGTSGKKKKIKKEEMLLEKKVQNLKEYFNGKTIKRTSRSNTS